MNMVCQRLLLLTVVLSGSGCAGLLQPDPNPDAYFELSAANTGSFGARPDIPTEDEIHRLTPEQESQFLDYMNNPGFTGLKPSMRLYQYLESITSDYEYEGITGDASRVLDFNSGNCMSLAVLTTALADIAGLEIDYQLMDDIPVYEFNSTIINKGVQIRSRIFDPISTEKDVHDLFKQPGVTIDYFPTNRQRFIGNINREEYLAMYYQNLAVEALERQDLNFAYWSALEALKFDPYHSAAVNTLAIANRRAGDLETAEFIYQYGIKHAQDKLSLMKNYAALLAETGRTEEARSIQYQLDTMTDPSPFHWFLLARDSQDKGDYREAIRFYNKALDLAPYLHEAWLGIAQSNYELGRLDRTRNALMSAYEEADKVSTRNLYQAKLAALSGELPL